MSNRTLRVPYWFNAVRQVFIVEVSEEFWKDFKRAMQERRSDFRVGHVDFEEIKLPPDLLAKIQAQQEEATQKALKEVAAALPEGEAQHG